MKDRRQSHTKEEEEAEVLRTNTEKLLKDSGAYRYEASPLFRTTNHQDPTRVFASPEEIATTRGYTIEIQDMNMNKSDLIEGFLSDLLGKVASSRSFGRGYYGYWAGDKNPKTGKPYHSKDLAQGLKRVGHVETNLGSVMGDVDVPTLQRNIANRVLAGDGSKQDLEALRTQNVTNYGNPNYGKIRTVHPGSKSRLSLKVEKPDTVSDETKAAALRRSEVYRTGSYKSLRGESIEQTEARILSEIKMNVKGGPMVDDTSEHLLSGVKDTIEDKVVESFIQDLNEVDGAMGAYVSGPTTAPPKAVDPAEKIFNAHVNTGSVQIPFKSREAERIKTSVDTPTLLRKAMTGDPKAQASIEKGEKSMRPESK